MDLWNILTMMVRRWYLTVPLLLATVAIAVSLASSLTSAYTSNAAVLIAAPNERLIEVAVDPLDPLNTDTRTEALAVNPLTSPVGGVSDAAAALQLKIYDGSTAREMDELGLSLDFFVEPLDRNSPILTIEATGMSPEQAISTVEYLIGRIDSDLDLLQSEFGAPVTERIDDLVLTTPDQAFPSSTGTTRTMLGIIMAGTVLTTLLVAAADLLISSRSDTDAAPATVHPVSPAYSSAEMQTQAAESETAPARSNRWAR